MLGAVERGDAADEMGLRMRARTFIKPISQLIPGVGRLIRWAIVCDEGLRHSSTGSYPHRQEPSSNGRPAHGPN